MRDSVRWPSPTDPHRRAVGGSRRRVGRRGAVRSRLRASRSVPLTPCQRSARARARRKFKHRSLTTRDPPPTSCPLRARSSTRPQPPARTDPRPHSAAFPPHEHTAPAPRPPSGRTFAPHRHSAASPTSAASPSATGGARHPDGSAPAAVNPSAASNRAIAAGSWIAASTRRGPAHGGQTSTSMPAARRSRSPAANAAGDCGDGYRGVAPAGARGHGRGVPRAGDIRPQPLTSPASPRCPYPQSD